MSDKEVEVGEEALTSTDVTISPQEDDIDDGSSIEVLNWSDFSEDEMEAARLCAAKEFPDDTNNVTIVPEESPLEPKSVLEPKSTVEVMTESQESTDSSATIQDAIKDAMSSKSSSQDEEEFQNLEYPADGGDDQDEDEDTEKDPEDTARCEEDSVQDDVFGSMLSISNLSKEDSVSNLPVLDDGPIWGKGEKLYRFHENRTINQKLTFGVLISVVLALGIGLGNLVAYQEYEGEQHNHHHHENSKIEQHFHHCPASRVPLTENTNDHVVVPNGFPSSTRISDQASSDDLIKQRTRTQDRYTIQQDALAYVVKSLDELSKKLDHFENTTRQLSGIIVMSDEARSSSTGRKSMETPAEGLSDQVSSWDVPSDRPLTFSQVVHSDQEISPVDQTPEQDSQLPVFPVPDNLNIENLLSTGELSEPSEPAEPSEPTEASKQEPIKPKSRHSKSKKTVKRQQQVNTFVPEHIQFHRKSKKDKKVNKIDHHQRDKSPIPPVPQEIGQENLEGGQRIPQEEVKRKRSVPQDEFQREGSPPEKFRRERSPPREDSRREWSPPREQNKREWSPPREHKRERSPPREPKREGSPLREQQRERSPPRGERERSPPGQRERSPPREDFRREGSPSRKQNHKRENSPLRDDFMTRPMPPPAHQKQRNRMENYPPRVIYLPENNYSNFEVKESLKKWKKEDDNSFDSFDPSKSRESKRKHKYDDRVIIDNPKGHEFPRGPFPDWDLERAKLRESQRVQSNWDKDFRAKQRKRQQNWQIERDRVRKEVRSKGL